MNVMYSLYCVIIALFSVVGPSLSTGADMTIPPVSLPHVCVCVNWELKCLYYYTHYTCTCS